MSAEQSWPSSSKMAGSRARRSDGRRSGSPRTESSGPRAFTDSRRTVRGWLETRGTTMPRTDNDSWDITESVGTTALGVAAARAAETDSENPLIRDPFARLFLDAAGPGMWSMFGNPTASAELAGVDPDLSARMTNRVDFMAVRTAFFDEFFISAGDAGI